jgi:hypothetical protein
MKLPIAQNDLSDQLPDRRFNFSELVLRAKSLLFRFFNSIRETCAAS